MTHTWPMWQSADQGRGVVVLLHGFMGRRQDWSAVTGRLPEGPRYLAFDLPGHGQHRAGACVDIPQMARGLWGQLDSLGCQRVVLLGYSMGGRVALEAAAQAPARVEALILESSSPGLMQGRQERVELDRQRAQALRRDPEGFLRAWYRAPLFSSLAARPQLLERHIQNILRHQDPEDLALVLEAASPGAQPPRWHLLEELESPVHCLAGHLDLRYREVMAQAVRRSRRGLYHLCRGVGHNIHLESPTLWSRVCAEILRGLSLNST